MNYWVTTDTHFGHDKLKLEEYSKRPSNFNNLILRNHRNTINKNDILIHIGDFCIGNDINWHKKFMAINSFKKWLIKGNHDKKSNSWYLSHGWDFVGDSMKLYLFGHYILFSHIPQSDNNFDINIHGHFHNSNHRQREPEMLAIRNEKHYLIMLEHHYSPISLKKIIENYNKSIKLINFKK